MWDDAWAYDVATGPYTEDLAYWTDLVKELKPKRVLDLGCGTGRISFAMATAGLAIYPGFQLVGIDLSPTFLDKARARVLSTFPAVSSAVRFIEGDMAAFTLRDQFDLIVIGYNSLAYLTSPEQREQCFRCVRRHLSSGGKVAIDLHVPNLALLAEAQAQVFPALRHEIEWVNPAPGVKRFVSFYKTGSYDAATQTEHTSHYWEIYHADGRRQSLVKELAWHHYFPSELRQLFCANGLAPYAEYGAYDRAPFTSASPNYLWISEAAGPAVDN